MKYRTAIPKDGQFWLSFFVYAFSRSRWLYYSTMIYWSYVKRTGERNPNMSCDIVSDLTISAIVCAMAGTEYGAAGLHDDAVRKLGKCYLMQILHP